jgi:hypothetical protein
MALDLAGRIPGSDHSSERSATGAPFGPPSPPDSGVSVLLPYRARTSAKYMSSAWVPGRESVQML